MNDMRPVEARVDQVGDCLHALFAQGREGRVGRQLAGLRLRALPLRRHGRDLTAAARDLVVCQADEERQQGDAGDQGHHGVRRAAGAAGAN